MTTRKKDPDAGPDWRSLPRTRKKPSVVLYPETLFFRGNTDLKTALTRASGAEGYSVKAREIVTDWLKAHHFLNQDGTLPPEPTKER